MTPSIEEFFKKTQECIRAFEIWADTYELRGSITADHVGYKCSSREEFEWVRALLERHSDFLYQSIISGRRIGIIKLSNPLETARGPLMFLELSDQKPDNSQKSGFDHLEFFPQKVSVMELVRYLEGKKEVVIKAERPHHVTYDISLSNNFKVRIEAESLASKIAREEMW